MHHIGVIGCGYWGPNLIRNFSQMNRTRVIGVADLRKKRLEHMKSLYPEITITTDYNDLLIDEKINIIAVATPVRTHFEFASQALRAGKHLFIEKPMTTSVKEAKELIKIAQEKKLKLMVGHTFLYTAAVRKMKEVIDSGELGDIYYINSQRLNLGLFQQDINVIWDLAPHDISIINFLLAKEPEKVSAFGASHLNTKIEDVATVTLDYGQNLIAFVQCSWLDPDKVRKMTVVGSKKMMVYDDVHPTEKIRIYDKAVEVPEHYDTYTEFHYSYKYGDVLIPKIEGKEPLREELNHFIDCIENNTTPISDGHNGLGVIKVLEQCSKTLSR